MMTHIDFVGYLAASLVLLTFQMKSMHSLRLTSVASSVAFIIYALVADLLPVLALHSILILTNLYRLQEMSGDKNGQGRLGEKPARLIMAAVVFVAFVLAGKPTNAGETNVSFRDQATGVSVVMDAVACTTDLLICSSITPSTSAFSEMADCIKANEVFRKEQQQIREGDSLPVIFTRCRYQLMNSVNNY